MIMSDRDEFIGGHVTPEAKKALAAEAVKSGKSMSRLIWEAVREKLLAAGHDIKEAA